MFHFNSLILRNFTLVCVKFLFKQGQSNSYIGISKTNLLVEQFVPTNQDLRSNQSSYLNKDNYFHVGSSTQPKLMVEKIGHWYFEPANED